MYNSCKVDIQLYNKFLSWYDFLAIFLCWGEWQSDFHFPFRMAHSGKLLSRHSEWGPIWHQSTTAVPRRAPRAQHHARMVHTAQPRATRPRGSTRLRIAHVCAIKILTAGDMRFLASRSMLLGFGCAHAPVATCFNEHRRATAAVSPL